MGTLTIDMSKVAVPKDFKSKFNGKTYTLKMPDSEMDGDTDKLKKPADFKNGDKLKKLLADVASVKDGLFSQFDSASFKSTIEELGTHDFEVKLKGENFKAKLVLQSSTGKDTRVVASTAPRKLGANPASVKVDGLSNVGSGCPSTDDVAHLLKQIAKTTSYVWSGKSGVGNGWTPQFKGHYTHEEPKVKGWKSYVDEPTMGTGTKWRLAFTLDYDEKADKVMIKIVSMFYDKH